MTQSTNASELTGVTVVLPVHGSAELLVALDARLRSAFVGRPLQIVMVDDASPDDALSVMHTLDVDVVQMARRGGQNAALFEGLRHVRHPIAVVMDADLQDPPEGAPGLVARLTRGDVGVVFSSRDGASPLSSRLFRAALRLLFPSLPPLPCLCFAMDERTRAALVSAGAPHEYLVATLGALGVPSASVAIERAARSSGHSAYGSLRRWRYAAWALGSALRQRVTVRREWGPRPSRQ